MGVAKRYIEIKIVNFSETCSDKTLNLLIKNDEDSNEDFIPNNDSTIIKDWSN